MGLITRILKLNPVYVRHMRLRVRSIKFPLSLVAYNLVLALIGFIGLEIGLNQKINSSIDYSAAVNVYMVLICIEILMLVCMIPAVTAASISAERERQTLDILLSTGIRPRNIVMGKFAESESMILIYVISSLPVLSLVFTIGGVSVRDIIMSFIEMIVTSIFIGSIGILASAFSKKTIVAVISSYAGIILFCAVTSVAVAVIIQISVAFGNHPDLSWTAVLLMLNPAADVVVMLSDQSGSIVTVDRLMNAIGISESFRNYWMPASVALRLFASGVFLYLAVRRVSPLTGRNR